MKLPLILDCTFRDGGYMTNWHFDDRLVEEVYRSVSKTGVDYIELGYRSSTESFDSSIYGTWRFSSEEAIRRVCNGISGARLAVMVELGRYDVDAIIPKQESAVDLIRIAVHGDKIRQAIEHVSPLKEKGYEVSLNLMGYATYKPERLQELRHMLTDVPLDFAYVADSYGSILPDQVQQLLEPLQSIRGVRVGFHPHNNLQMAFANSLEAIRCGVDIIDGSIYGIGRAAGNLPLEVLIAYLQTKRPDRYNVVPVLNIIDRFFVRQQRETPWGYQLSYMLSGLFNVHPNYAKHLVEKREYPIEDVWKALQLVKRQEPIGFEQDRLNELVERGLIGGSLGDLEDSLDFRQRRNRTLLPKHSVKYVDRYPGRDFLVLGSGPSLRTYQENIKEFIDRYDPIILGANYLGGMFVPHYHAFNSKRRFMDYIEQVDQQSKLLLGCNFEETFIHERTTRDFEWLVFENTLSQFDIVDGVISSNCRTISVLLCGVALVMGAQRIFAVGLDGYLGIDTAGSVHFYDESDETTNSDMLLEKHHRCYEYLTQINDYAEAHLREGIHILTPTSYAKYYKGLSNYLH